MVVKEILGLMARTRHRPRKRKFHGNQHTQRSPKSAKIESPERSEDVTECDDRQKCNQSVCLRKEDKSQA